MSEARRLGLLFGLLLGPVAAGCGRGLPPTMDVGEARAAVAAALDTWKDGGSPEKLRARKPTVDFRDLSWDQGSKLKKYDIEKQEQSGTSARVTVTLNVAEKSGMSRTRVVVYNVD